MISSRQVSSISYSRSLKLKSDIFIVLTLFIVDSFLLGGGFRVVSNLFTYISVLILVPRSISLCRKNELYISIIFLIFFFYVVAVIKEFNLSVVMLESSFALRIIVFVTILFSEFNLYKVQKQLIKYLMIISCISMLIQFVISYKAFGTGMLLRGDRNHSAVIITQFFMLCYALWNRKLTIAFLFIPLNFSRNLLLGALILFSERVMPMEFLFRHKWSIMFSLVIFLNGIFFFYGILLENFFTGPVGSTNDLSRLIVIFDGSNNLRFNLNYEFLVMIGQDWVNYIVYSGVYSDLKEVLGLYPHNSYLHLVYRIGILRSLLIIVLIIYFIKSKRAVLFSLIFFIQAAFIHEMFLNSCIIFLGFLLSIEQHRGLNT